ncbi:MAG: hypothetical protein PHS13_08515 [Firmicutes bacterium]|jgi:hypothetical protein|nr:hypothetical protein [Bacillota bacterium]
MKEVKYSICQKLLTVIASIIMGCEYTKDINEVLGPEKLSAVEVKHFLHRWGCAHIMDEFLLGYSIYTVCGTLPFTHR